MQLALMRVVAIALALAAAGCTVGTGLFSGNAPPPVSPEQDAQEDRQCQSTGYQINTPAYDYCRGELARHRAVAENIEPVPHIGIAR
jgi:hypothetical protein